MGHVPLPCLFNDTTELSPNLWEIHIQHRNINIKNPTRLVHMQHVFSWLFQGGLTEVVDKARSKTLGPPRPKAFAKEDMGSTAPLRAQHALEERWWCGAPNGHVESESWNLVTFDISGIYLVYSCGMLWNGVDVQKEGFFLAIPNLGKLADADDAEADVFEFPSYPELSSSWRSWTHHQLEHFWIWLWVKTLVGLLFPQSVQVSSHQF